MLVLSRRVNEEIVIGDNIVVKVLDVGRGRIRLGIEAPRDVPVKRSELLPVQAASVPERKAA